MSLTILVQGPVYSWTNEFIRRYKTLPYVSEVIFSTWQNEPEAHSIGETNSIKIIESQKPENLGQGNRNAQIVSSLAGLKEVKTKYAIKVRSDLFLPHLDSMLAFYHERKRNESIYTLSIYPRFPFHPRDYVFLGETKHLLEAFDIPLDPTTKKYDEWNDTRTETYIGAFYYRKYDNRIQRYIDNPQEYFGDNSPKRNEALEVYHQLIREEKGFLPFPPVAIELPKHYPQGYPFSWLQQLYGEIYADDKFFLSRKDFPS